MKELSLNILDIAQNSVKAGAKNISIEIEEGKEKLTVTITDDGCGMTGEQVEKLKDPFFTTRTTRKVGLGIPFFTLAAEQTGGNVSIKSKSETEHPEDHGTTVKAVFFKTSIDFTPLGDVVSTLLTLIHGADSLDYTFSHKTEKAEVFLSTAEMRSVLGEEIPLSSPEVLEWAREYLVSQYSEIK